ncbi:MAG: cyclic nucleotide-binding domain-containing protein [Bdellovibrionaceae bacterium]|nr:cyclic nucleotide-binding domain-containing protein [Pseudobdellovibrionaceae bacterium]
MSILNKVYMDTAETIHKFSKLGYFNTMPASALKIILSHVKVVSMPMNSEILSQGQKNSKLYFLMDGTVEVFVDRGKVATLDTEGELLGEISLIRKETCSATIISSTDVTLCYLEVEQFNNSKNKLINSYLYQIYANILSVKVQNTNEKAKHFESLILDLKTSRNKLQKVNQSLQSKVMTKTRVLIFEESKKQQNIAKMAIGSCGAYTYQAFDLDSAKKILQSKNIDVVFVSLDFLDQLNSIENSWNTVVMTNGAIKDYIEKIKVIDSRFHIMSRNDLDKKLTIQNFTSTFNKLSTLEFFGVHKYLTHGIDVRSHKVSGSEVRHTHRERLLAYFTKVGVRSSNVSRISTVTEELLMNAIYDAPHDSDGKPIFNHINRRDGVHLKREQRPTISYACDGILAAVSVADPFGALSAEIVSNYLINCYSEDANLNDGKHKGGAGRGLHQIIEGADQVIFNLHANVKTEIIALFNVDHQGSEHSTPSFHIFHCS